MAPGPIDAPDEAVGHGDPAGFAVPLRLLVGDQVLTFISTTTVFGTPIDVSLEQLAAESFFPAEARCAAWLPVDRSAVSA